MYKKGILTIALTLMLTLSACSSPGSAVESATVTETAGAAVESTLASTDTLTDSTETVAAEIPVNGETHDDAADYTWDAAEEITVQLNGDSITAGSPDVVIDGSTATITAAGTYRLSGSLSDGQVIVETEDEDTVRLILDGVEITSASSAPIYISKADKTILVLAEGSVNTITDGSSYVLADPESDEPNAAIFAASDLTITGTGSLEVNGNYNDGIATKDGLILAAGSISVSAVDDGIRGKDYVYVKEGGITVTAQGDGIKSDNDTDTSKGFITIDLGRIEVTSGGDAISAQTNVLVSGGELILDAGGGSDAVIDENLSAKGIKGGSSVTVANGIVTIDSADDSLHSNNSITINNGVVTLSSGDDGMHADTALTINAGDVRILKSYEGIESAVITLNNGSVKVNASDDGINVSGGVDGSGMMPGGRPFGGKQGPGGPPPGQDTFNYTGDYYLYINGGLISVHAGGDGIDSNGAIEMTNGIVIVNGPTQDMNGALDYMGGFKMKGGFLVTAGSAGMAQAPDSSSSQNSLLLNLTSAQQAGTTIHIQDSSGKDILTFTPAIAYQSITYSSPYLVTGETYTVFLGGTAEGEDMDGLYESSTYSDGTEYTTFTVSETVTSIGSIGMRR
ncbi:MAG TPA: carbohydrate-binding domain-containing protein [Anaerolineaceae bacterium]|nr:carbohydrate-binding domain-containing protein [Anaerolineaceae bacterium]